MSDVFECKFCKKTFSNNSNLKSHIKTARYCLEIQSKVGNSGVETNSIKCDFCFRVFTQKVALTKHTCIKQLEFEFSETLALKDKEIKEQNITISKLEKSLKKSQLNNLKLKEELAFEKGCISGYEKVKPPKSSTIVKNNNKTYINPKLSKVSIDNIRPLTIENIQEDLYRYTYEDFLKKGPGVIDFINNMIQISNADNSEIVERNYVCTDKSRNTFYRLTNSKEWSLDNGATYLYNVMNALREDSSRYMSHLRETDRSKFKEFQNAVHADEVFTATLFHMGIMDDEGKFRENLFNEVRNGIRDKASI